MSFLSGKYIHIFALKTFGCCRCCQKYRVLIGIYQDLLEPPEWQRTVVEICQGLSKFVGICRCRCLSVITSLNPRKIDNKRGKIIKNCEVWWQITLGFFADPSWSGGGQCQKNHFEKTSQPPGGGGSVTKWWYDLDQTIAYRPWGPLSAFKNTVKHPATHLPPPPGESWSQKPVNVVLVPNPRGGVDPPISCIPSLHQTLTRPRENATSRENMPERRKQVHIKLMHLSVASKLDMIARMTPGSRNTLGPPADGWQLQKDAFHLPLLCFLWQPFHSPAASGIHTSNLSSHITSGLSPCVSYAPIWSCAAEQTTNIIIEIVANNGVGCFQNWPSNVVGFLF